MGTPRPKGKRPMTEGTVEHIDDLLYIIRGNDGEIQDAGVDEFAELERKHTKYLKLTFQGCEGTKPLVLMIESESPITVRKLGKK